ncbi:MAG: hypothetical protein ACLRRS_11710 [Faecalibacterium prausnitzii]|uniref:hypothetical protein n=1 Tax=Faecalibacterium prausnitzii TaxID=853 RepID=UPI003A2C9A0A
MVLQKSFKCTPENGLICVNTDDVSTYIQNKVELFRNYENYTSKQKKIELLEEILQMYNEDIQNPQIDMSEMSNIVYSDKVNIKQMIQYFDLVWILGSIAFNIFDYGNNALNHTEDGMNGPINMGEMVWQAYNQLHIAKINGEKAAYGATLIFTTVLESELKKKFKILFIQDKLAEVDNIVSQGTYSLLEDEKELIKYLRQDENAKEFNAVYATTQAAYELFKNVGVLETANQDQKNILLNKTTLNQLLGYSFFANKVEPAFLAIMKLLFQTGNLNLRNDIAHGGFGYKNYYHTSATGLLYFMSTFVFNDEYLL